jgi:hypothetical protein
VRRGGAGRPRGVDGVAAAFAGGDSLPPPPPPGGPAGGAGRGWGGGAGRTRLHVCGPSAGWSLGPLRVVSLPVAKPGVLRRPHAPPPRAPPPRPPQMRVKGKAAIDVICNPLGKSGGALIQQFMVRGAGRGALAGPGPWARLRPPPALPAVEALQPRSASSLNLPPSPSLYPDPGLRLPGGLHALPGCHPAGHRAGLDQRRQLAQQAVRGDPEGERGRLLRQGVNPLAFPRRTRRSRGAAGSIEAAGCSGRRGGRPARGPPRPADRNRRGGRRRRDGAINGRPPAAQLCGAAAARLPPPPQRAARGARAPT